jgi:hypothetical protein
MEIGMGMHGEFAGGAHVEVWVDGVVVEGDEGVRPCVGPGFGKDGGCSWDKTGIEGIEGNGARGVSLMMPWSWRKGAYWTS